MNAPRKRGRPRQNLYSDEEIIVACAGAPSLAAAARNLGVSRQNVYLRLERDPTLRPRIEAARLEIAKAGTASLAARIEQTFSKGLDALDAMLADKDRATRTAAVKLAISLGACQRWPDSDAEADQQGADERRAAAIARVLAARERIDQPPTDEVH